MFSVDHESGEVRCLASLNREERAAFFVPIRVSDGGNPRQSTDIDLEIHLDDQDDNQATNQTLAVTVAFIDDFIGPLGDFHPVVSDVVGEFNCSMFSTESPFQVRHFPDFQ
jgi:hypothetical protein